MSLVGRRTVAGSQQIGTHKTLTRSCACLAHFRLFTKMNASCRSRDDESWKDSTLGPSSVSSSPASLLVSVCGTNYTMRRGKGGRGNIVIPTNRVSFRSSVVVVSFCNACLCDRARRSDMQLGFTDSQLVEACLFLQRHNSEIPNISAPQVPCCNSQILLRRAALEERHPELILLNLHY